VSKKLQVLITGATGYVGGRLVPELLSRDVHVRCLVRTPAKTSDAPWRDQVEIVAGDVGGPLDVALAGIDVAVYLVHGIGDGPDWAAKEIADAEHFRIACEVAGVKRIVYLGGMGDDSSNLSVHLRSRHTVGTVLASGPIPVIELRAAVIIGSGSASFEMLRYLVEVLPVMVTPKWVRTKSQPIAISDVLHYMVQAITTEKVPAGIYEIGGPDVVSYAELMALYAEEAGLNKRRLIPVPVLTPRLSSHWVGIVTPVPASLAAPLIESLANEVIVHDDKATNAFGAPQRTLREAIHLALGRSQSNNVPTRFSDADLQVFRAYVTDPRWAGGTELTDVRERDSTASPQEVYETISRIGGEKGWYSGGWLWRLRGAIDRVWGGPGLRRGRRDPAVLHVGDFVDFWRVTEADPAKKVALHAEMRLPGDAWLEWEIVPTETGSHVIQRARYKPRGLFGRIYWYGVLPFHAFIFPGMLKGILGDAELLI
jgi:uncharacterized protein YbjT (DUF2867 family)